MTSNLYFNRLRTAIDLQDSNKVRSILQLLWTKNLATKVVNQLDACGYTLLFWATRVNNIEIVKLLLRYGAGESINHRCNNNPRYTAMYNSRLYDNREIAKLLIMWGSTALLNIPFKLKQPYYKFSVTDYGDHLTIDMLTKIYLLTMIRSIPMDEIKPINDIPNELLFTIFEFITE